MAVIAGIDEAGFGPLLGPLVISSVCFSIDKSMLAADLWDYLSKSVGYRRRGLSGRLLICDSKKAHNKTNGISHLQRTSLSCLKLLAFEPENLDELLQTLCPHCRMRLLDYPWHRYCEKVALEHAKADIAIASKVFANDMKANNIKLLDIQSNCLDVRHYNRMVDVVRNKSNVLFSATAELLMNAWEKYAQDSLQVIIDRQGGRVHYREHLSRIFTGAKLRILKETPSNSSYEITQDNRQMKVHFVVKADNDFLPVSLASMVSKYLRELLVANINKYFVSLHPQLKPTAGYWKDGLRFVEDIKANIPNLDYEHSMLVRSR